MQCGVGQTVNALDMFSMAIWDPTVTYICLLPIFPAILYAGFPHTSQISHLVLYPSLWLLVSGMSSQFTFLCNLLLKSPIYATLSYNLLLKSPIYATLSYNLFLKSPRALVSGILLQDFASFGNPCTCMLSVAHELLVC